MSVIEIVGGAILLVASLVIVFLTLMQHTHGQGLTPLHEAIYQHVRKEVAFYEVDREIWPDIRAVEKMIRSGELLDIVKEYIPDFE